MFFEGPRSRFACKLAEVRCVARVRGGKRCARTTKHTAPFCEHHCATFLGVKVSPSTQNVGYGLFALRYFDAGEPIAPLIGEKITPAENIRRYGRYADSVAPYVVSCRQHGRLPVLIDGACRRGVGFYSNTVLGSSDHEGGGFRVSDEAACNARVQTLYLNALKLPSTTPMNWIVSTTMIGRGMEILTDYGPRFAVQTGPENMYTYTTC